MDSCAVHATTRASVDRSTFYFHWKYLNESLPPARQDKIGWVVARIDNLPEPLRSQLKYGDQWFYNEPKQFLVE